DAARSSAVEGLAEIERVRHGIQHGLRGHVGFGGMEGGRQLDVVDAQLACERRPVFDGAVGIGVPDLARRQLLQRRRQDAHLHALRLERADRGRPKVVVYARICFANWKHFLTSSVGVPAPRYSYSTYAGIGHFSFFNNSSTSRSGVSPSPQGT